MDIRVKTDHITKINKLLDLTILGMPCDVDTSKSSLALFLIILAL